MDSGNLPDDYEGAAMFYPLRDGYRIRWWREGDWTWTAEGTHESHKTILKHASTKALAINLVKDEIDELMAMLKLAGS